MASWLGWRIRAEFPILHENPKNPKGREVIFLSKVSFSATGFLMGVMAPETCIRHPLRRGYSTKAENEPVDRSCCINKTKT
jgi:hypothetical protein